MSIAFEKFESGGLLHQAGGLRSLLLGLSVGLALLLFGLVVFGIVCQRSRRRRRDKLCRRAAQPPMGPGLGAGLGPGLVTTRKQAAAATASVAWRWGPECPGTIFNGGFLEAEASMGHFSGILGPASGSGGFDVGVGPTGSSPGRSTQLAGLAHSLNGSACEARDVRLLGGLTSESVSRNAALSVASTGQTQSLLGPGSSLLTYGPADRLSGRPSDSGLPDGQMSPPSVCPTLSSLTVGPSQACSCRGCLTEPTDRLHSALSNPLAHTHTHTHVHTHARAQAHAHTHLHQLNNVNSHNHHQHQHQHQHRQYHLPPPQHQPCSAGLAAHQPVPTPLWHQLPSPHMQSGHYDHWSRLSRQHVAGFADGLSCACQVDDSLACPDLESTSSGYHQAGPGGSNETGRSASPDRQAANPDPAYGMHAVQMMTNVSWRLALVSSRRV
ncbi:unnamed protein product [Protopolystoma xenopodis]|uniref:Uncharacterized protein n=1 Tax=Protopolystoma xenopodis TaxID=117903 RepID=A0A448XRT3_9PLAT|nr:unnamed protein product [Protopolystoma xenopodis]